jgi:hypothetical protein
MGMRLLLVVGLLAAFATAAASAQARFSFGSKLDSTVQPSGAFTKPCGDPSPLGVCTWVMNEAYGRPNHGQRSPHAGTIKKIRLIAENPGRFRLQIVRVRRTNSGFEAKAVRNGPRIRYQGQPDQNQPYLVEVFRVNIPVHRGDRLAIKAKKTSALRCSSGGPNTLLFAPPLAVGGGYEPSTDDEGCWLLLEAVARRG